LFPSFHEGLPVTLIEAQATGLPCLVSDTISYEADIGGGLVQFERITKSPQAWAEQVFAFVGNVKRVPGNVHLRDNGYDINQTAAWLQGFYTRISGNKRAIEKNKAT